MKGGDRYAKRMEKHVLRDWIAWMDAVWLFAWLGRNATRSTVSEPDRADAAVYFMDAATGATGSDGSVCSACWYDEGAGDPDA